MWSLRCWLANRGFLWSWPLPCCNFFCEIGSSPWCFDISGGGKIKCTPKSMACEKCVKYSSLRLFAAAMKSWTKTSTRLMKVVVARSRNCGEASCGISPLNRCSGSCTSSRRASMTSRTVSDAAQKKGGDSHQPICKQFGTTIYVLSSVVLGSVCGRM